MFWSKNFWKIWWLLCMTTEAQGTIFLFFLLLFIYKKSRVWLFLSGQSPLFQPGSFFWLFHVSHCSGNRIVLMRSKNLSTSLFCFILYPELPFIIIVFLLDTRFSHSKMICVASSSAVTDCRWALLCKFLCCTDVSQWQVISPVIVLSCFLLSFSIHFSRRLH